MIIEGTRALRALSVFARLQLSLFLEKNVISDVLCDAMASIRDYQQKSPEMYGNISDGLNTLLTHMDCVLCYLNSPPNNDPERRKRQLDLLLALASVNVSRLVAARIRLQNCYKVPSISAKKSK